jgi:hypothetical protein
MSIVLRHFPDPEKESQLARDGQRPWGDPARRPRPADVAGTVIGPARWVRFVFALIITAIELRIFGKVMRRGFGGSKRLHGTEPPAETMAGESRTR